MSRDFGKPFEGKEHKSVYMQLYHLGVPQSARNKKRSKPAERPTARASLRGVENNSVSGERMPRRKAASSKSALPQWGGRAAMPSPEFAPWAARALLGEIMSSAKAFDLIPRETRLALIHELSQP